MAAHIHAALMAEYAKDAAESETPWKNWEFRNICNDEWENMSCHPSWVETCKYRRKPKTIRIGDMEVPEPMKTAPEYGTVYWFPSFRHSTSVNNFIWSGNAGDNRMLQCGFCHATKEAAEAHAQALILISGGTF